MLALLAKGQKSGVLQSADILSVLEKLDINAEQLDMLLLLRQKTDQRLLERKAERQEDKP